MVAGRIVGDPMIPSLRLEFWLGRAAHGGTETFLELVDTTFCVNKLLLTSEERMGI